MKSMWTIIFSIFLALCFIGFGAALPFFMFLKPSMDARNILKNGVETTAKVIHVNNQVGKIDGKQYYYLELSFRNAQGEEIKYETRSLYPESFIREQGIASKNDITGRYDIIEKETVQVMYKGNKAVLKDFVLEKGNGWLWLFPAIFGSIGIVLFIGLLFSLISVMTVSKIKEEGISGTGMYLKNDSLPAKNGTTMYNIYFTFENGKGKSVEVETGYIYDGYEAEALIEMQSFPVKFIGDKAIIVVDKSEFLRFKAKKTLQDLK